MAEDLNTGGQRQTDFLRDKGSSGSVSESNRASASARSCPASRQASRSSSSANAQQARGDARRNNASNLFIENILGAFSRSVSDRMEEAVVDATGLSSSACYAIVTIGSEPSSSIEKLRHFLEVEHSSLVRLLNGLEKKGLIVRRKGDGADKRTVLIDLSDSGEDCFTRILDARHAVLNEAVSRIGLDDKEHLFRLISKMMPAVVKPGDDQHYVCRLCDLELCPQEICPVNLAHPENFELPDKPFRRRCNSRL